MSEPHLWEVDHDYYGPESPFFGDPAKTREYNNTHASWAEFIDEGMHDAPEGMNLLYRWDWHDWAADHDDRFGPMVTETGHSQELHLFWMMPRKGIMARSVIAVTPDDEPAVRAWLGPHWAYMRALWAPLAEGGSDA